MGSGLRMYLRLITASLRAQMQYKFDFIVSTLFDGLLQSVDFALLAAIMLRFPEIGGWNIYEIGILYGMAWIAMSLYRTLAPELHNFEEHIIQGTFDGMLIRPWPALMVLLSRNIEPMRLGGAILGAIIFSLSARHLLALGALDTRAIVYMIGMAFIGTLIPASLSLLTASFAFWIGRSNNLQTFTMYAPITASQYPLTVFPGWLRALLTSVLPVGFINFIPVHYLLGKGGTWVALMAAPLVALLTFGVAYQFWRFGQRHYHSTGS